MVATRNVPESVEKWRRSLTEHPLYHAMSEPKHIVCFLQHHVWAVWDFMSLLKALQRKLTWVSVPWVPPADPMAARLINSIVLGEESDEDGEGGYCSHFEMYRQAMVQAGADSGPIDRFVLQVRAGTPWREAIDAAPIPDFVRRFVTFSLSVATGSDLPALAAAFTLGREDLIPAMFLKMLEELADRHPERFDRLRHYLRRHVEVDGEEHGPAALMLLDRLCPTEADRKRAEAAASAALQARHELWDGILADLS